MLAIRTTGAVIMACVLTGCGAFEFAEDQYAVDRLTTRAEEQPEKSRDDALSEAPGRLKAVNLDSYRLNLGTETVAFHDASTPVQRREWIAFLMDRSDSLCEQHKAAIIANHATANGLFGAAATVVGGAGALVTGVTAARVLSGTAGMLTGIRATYNEVFFQNILASAVVREIRKLRQTRRQEIVNRLDTGGYNQMGLHRALLDIHDYHGLCSFYVGLVELTEDAGKIKPVTRHIKAQTAAAEAAIIRYKTEITDASLILADSDSPEETKDYARNRLRDLNAAIAEQERLLRSLNAQLSLAAVASDEAPPAPAAAPDGG